MTDKRGISIKGMRGSGKVKKKKARVVDWNLMMQKKSDSYFSYVFDSFSPFYAKERIAPVTLCSFALF